MRALPGLNVADEHALAAADHRGHPKADGAGTGPAAIPLRDPLQFRDSTVTSATTRFARNNALPRSHSRIFKGTKFRFLRDVSWLAVTGRITVVDRSYFTRQVKTLLNFAHSTNNPKLAAVLVEKAAALKTQLDEASPPRDLSPQAPDVAPEL
jgi:hypothetical protein